jgi:RNA polymerase sigma-70 factor (ECF subfamily)
MADPPPDPPAATDFELLDAWSSGDTVAGDALIRRYFDTLYRFFRTKVERGLEDMVQRTFLGCIEARDRFRRETSFRVFLLAIARNQLLLYYRKKGRSKEVPQLYDGSAPDPGDSPSRIVVHREEQRLLLKAMRSISLDLQITLELHYWEQLKIEEIAEVLAIPEGTVKSRLHRARQVLKEKLAKLATSPELLKTTSDNLDRWAHSLRDLVSQPERKEG